MEEAWISVDLESTGAVPGLYDLVSIGATVIFHDDPVAAELVTREKNPLKRPTFYVELQPHGGLTDPDAMAVHGLTQDYLLAEGLDPAIATRRFVDWVKEIVGDKRPVFCSFGTFDWMWMGYYLEKYGKKYVVPFGPNSLDLKSFYLGLIKGSAWRLSQKRHMPKEDLRGRHTHNALDDAIEQAEMAEGWMKKYGRVAAIAQW